MGRVAHGYAYECIEGLGKMVVVLSDVLRPRYRFVDPIDRRILCRYSVTEGGLCVVLLVEVVQRYSFGT